MLNINYYLSMIGCCLLSVQLSAQLLGEHYIYGCENCEVTDFKVVGPHKILFDFTKFNKRKLILLNKENLKVDEIRVGSPTGISPLSSNSFSVAELGAAVEISIEEDQLEVEAYLSYRYNFTSIYGLSYSLFNDYYCIGIGAHTDDGPHYFSFLPLNQKCFLQYTIGKSHNDYNMKGDTIFILSGKEPLNQELKHYKFINGDMSLSDEANYPSATWVDYSVKEGIITIFSGHLQRLFKVKVEDEQPHVISEFVLPKKKEIPHGWYYFGDYQANKDYFLLPASEGKTNNELMVLKAGKLQKVAEVPFVPVDIENGIIYQLKQGDQSADIYGYPLEKNSKKKMLQYDIKN